MTSLEGLLQRHGSVLILDCASAWIQVGLARPATDALWRRREGEAGVELFRQVSEVLNAAELPLEGVGALAFNHGPGSILGIRTAAVALRTWCAVYPKTTYNYNGLRLFALGQARVHPDEPFSAIADARRETWHRIRVDAQGGAGPCERVPKSALAGKLLHPAEFRSWSAKPHEAIDAPYDIGPLFRALSAVPLFMEDPEPDAFLHEEPTYQTWNPQVHRAPR